MYSWEGAMDPGKLESFVQEKEVGVYELSKISMLREMDKNMRNDSVYTYMDSKIIFKKKKPKRMNITEGRIKVISVEKELIE